VILLKNILSIKIGRFSISFVKCICIYWNDFVSFDRHCLYVYDDDFETDYCPYLSLMLASHDSIIYANVETSKFYITTQKDHNDTRFEIPFRESIVCGLAVDKNQNLTNPWFTYWNYDEGVEKYISILHLVISV